MRRSEPKACAGLMPGSPTKAPRQLLLIYPHEKGLFTKKAEKCKKMLTTAVPVCYNLGVKKSRSMISERIICKTVESSDVIRCFQTFLILSFFFDPCFSRISGQKVGRSSDTIRMLLKTLDLQAFAGFSPKAPTDFSGCFGAFRWRPCPESLGNTVVLPYL